VITPNLASRPFLNTRPVWIVTVVSGLLALILILLDLRLMLISNRVLEDEIAVRDALEERHAELISTIEGDVRSLQRVPWGSLESRVNATNAILREQSFSWLQMLNDIEEAMPYDVRLTRISPSVGSDAVVISFEVIAKNRDAMLAFIDNLLADPRFEDPTLTSETTPEDSTAGDYMLRLRVRYLPPEGMS
jgi:hypothetical protein